MGPPLSRACWHVHPGDRVALSFAAGCDKSCAMIWMRVAVLALVLAVEAGCTSGGGGSSSPPSVPWEKFRQDLGNTGEGIAGVIKNPGGTPTPVAILWQKNIDNSKISASPAISIESQLFIGTEHGTLAALNLSDGSSAWPSNVVSCSACNCPTSPGLGTLKASPAVYTNNNQTNVLVASEEGSVYGFQFSGNNAPSCVFCLQPACKQSPPPACGEPPASVSFVSSPSFTINPSTSNISGIFIGATVTDGSGGISGRLYALNADGTCKWQFPNPFTGATPTPTPAPGTPSPTAVSSSGFGPITSSPAISLGNTVYFTTDDGFLYALTPNGDFLWRVELAGGSALPLAPSPVANTTSIITSSANGVILALNANGSFYWGLDARSDDPDFANSLAVGVPANTPTPTGTAAPTAVTPTLTPVPGVSLLAVVAIHSGGTVSLIDAATGIPLRPDPLAKIAGPVVSSPALSSDGYIIIGDHDGVLHAISTVDGSEPHAWNWPIILRPTPQATPQPIRSSPALDGGGVAYVGSDDGYLYAVGTK